PQTPELPVNALRIRKLQKICTSPKGRTYFAQTLSWASSRRFLNKFYVAVSDTGPFHTTQNGRADSKRLRTLQNGLLALSRPFLRDKIARIAPSQTDSFVKGVLKRPRFPKNISFRKFFSFFTNVFLVILDSLSAISERGELNMQRWAVCGLSVYSRAAS
ncbi:MAG: hypothetical protein II150_10610, partial [Thermoguttaceae bacterium]|nr:hypothetical protein [Thermoguttaceae bacterium]